MITVWQPGYLKPLDRFMPSNREAKTEMEKYKYKERQTQRERERACYGQRERAQLLLSRHKRTKCGSLFCCCCAACAPLAVSSTCCKRHRRSAKSSQRCRRPQHIFHLLQFRFSFSCSETAPALFLFFISLRT